MQHWNVDLHMHTRHSRDAVLTPAELIACARAAGLDRIAITDHNTLDGAHEAAAIDPDFVIPGEEIDCAGGGHLIGLFLTNAIPPGLPLEHIAARIRDQGGIVYAPHPFAHLWNGAERARRAIAIADVIEVHNSRAFAPAWNRRAADAARRTGLPAAAGSDSHFTREVGSAYTEMPPFHDVATFRAALAGARPVGLRTASPLVHVASVGTHLLRAATDRLPRRSRA